MQENFHSRKLLKTYTVKKNLSFLLVRFGLSLPSKTAALFPLQQGGNKTTGFGG